MFRGDTGRSGSVMTPTACSPGDTVLNSRRNSHTEDHVLAGDLSTPVPAGVPCTMEVSELRVVLTAPLLSGTASTNGSGNGGRGDCSSDKSGSDGGREDGATSDQSEKPNRKDGGAAEGRAEGCRKLQGKEQRHQIAEQPLWRPVSCLVEKECATVGAGEDGRPDLDPGEKEIEKGVRKSVDDTSTSQVATTSNSAAGFDATDELAVLRRSASGGTAEATFAADDAASIANLSPESQGVQVHLHRESAETQQRVQRPRVCRSNKQEEMESNAAQEILTKPGQRRDSLDAPLCTTRCSTAQQSPSPNLAPEKEAATEKEPAAEVTAVAEGKRVASICDDGVPYEAAPAFDRQKLDCHDKGNGQQHEEEQQKTSSSVSPTSITTEQSVKVQQSEHLCQLQEQIVPGQSQDAPLQAEQQERHHVKQQERHRVKQQEQQQKRKQTDEINDREGSRARAVAEEVGMKEGRGVLATGMLESRGTARENECGAGKCTPPGGDDNHQNACDAPEALQRERQLLLEELEHLQKEGCRSEDSTGSPSKRTSFEDAVEGTVGSVKERNSTAPPQGLHWHRRQEEKKEQVAQQCSSKEEGDGHIEDELKKSVTAVLAVTLRGKAGREARNEGNASYPPSPASGEASSDGSTTSSFETAASSQSQSPLNLQKEEAAEGTRCGITNNSGMSTATNSNGHVSRTPATNQHSSSAAPDKRSVDLSNRSSDSLSHRGSTTRSSAAAGSNTLVSVSDSAPGNRSASDRGDICKSRSSRDNSALCGGSRLPDDSGVSRSKGGGNAGGCDGRSVFEASHVSGSSSGSSTSGVTSAARAQDRGLGSISASGNVVSDNAAACIDPLLKSSSVVLKHCTVSQAAGNSEYGVNRTSALVGAAVLEDCFHSVKDLEQHAARVLLVPSAQTGGAKQQVLLPSLLLQKTTLGDGGRLTECSLWGGKREKLNTLSAARTAEALLSSASSAFGLYQSSLNEAAVGEVRKNPVGMMLLPPAPDRNVDINAANAGACGLMQQQLTSNLFSGGGGQPLLGTGTVGPALPGTPAGVGAETAAGALEQSLSQMWMLHQRSGCLGAPLSPNASSSIQLPSTLPAACPWPSPGAAPNIGAVTSVVRTPATTAVAAAALLPRSFRSRSDYLSLCSLQGCPATQENERKPRTLEELRQLPSDEYISLQEMHLLAESLVSEFMKLQHSSLDSSTSSRSTARVRRQGTAQKNTKEDDECGVSVTGSAATVVQRTEPLILHYRRDNLSFSVTPASSFTPFPPSVFEGARKKTHPRNSGGSRVSVAVRDTMDEMEEEKKETLLGARYFTPSDFHLNSNCPPASSDRVITRRESAARGHVRKNSASDGARTSPAKGTNADEFVLPHATTHLFRARCQQAGTETGINDSTIGAVDRAFAEATASFFRETQRQNGRCSCVSDTTVGAGLDEHGGKQQRTCSCGKGTTEEPRVNAGKADIRAPSTRSSGSASRSYQRLVSGNNSGADWRQGRVN